MPADMAISSAPALTGEKCQVSPRRRDRGVNDTLSNYLSPLRRPGRDLRRPHETSNYMGKDSDHRRGRARLRLAPQLSHPRLRPGLYFLKWRRLKHCGIYSVNTLIRQETSWKGYFQARNQSRIHRYKWDLRGNTICAREMDYSLAHGWLIQQPTLISGGRREVLTGFDREHI